MNDDQVYLRYTRAGLDREYDNRAKVADSAEQIAWYTSESRLARSELEARRDVRYGESEAETLDIFGAGDGVAVNVFFHGGYWKALHKDDFSFVARAFVPAGAISVVVNYGLIPDIDMTTLVDQCRRAMIWLYRNVARYGGDPERLHVSGHSAGGHLVAMMMATDWPALDSACPASLVAGGLGISGLYDLEPIRLCFLNDDLHLDRASVEANSPIRLAKRCSAPLELVYGGEEGDEYARQSLDLAGAWPQTRARAIDGHHHFSILRELSRPDGALARRALAMMGVL